MERIFDSKQIKLLYEQYHMEKYLDTQALPFFICSFQPGEMIYRPGDETLYLHFVLTGTMSIYDIRDDGSKYVLAQGGGFSLLGDLEFAHGTLQTYYAQAISRVLCLSLLLAECQSRLKRDCRFLNYIIEGLTEKLLAIAHEESAALPLKERVLNHMRYHCNGGRLKGLEKSAHILHCSSRQLQRLLNELAAEGQIRKAGKGTYELLG